MGSIKRGDFIEIIFAYPGDFSTITGVAGDQYQEWSFIRGTPEDLVEEFHRAGGVGQGSQAR